MVDMETPSNPKSLPKPNSQRIAMDGSVSPASSRSLEDDSLQIEKLVSQLQKEESKKELKETCDEFMEKGQSTNAKKRPRSSPKTNTMAKACFILLLLALVLVLWFLFLKPEAPLDDGILRLNQYKDGQVISYLPFDLCPSSFSEGESTICDSTKTVVRTDTFCNLVAQAMLMATGSDLVLINAGVCAGDIAAPTMTAGDIRTAIELSEVSILETSGDRLIEILEDAVNATLSGNSIAGSTSYPYAAGLRYKVAVNEEFGDRVSDIEMEYEGSGFWVPLNRRRFYKIATTAKLVQGYPGYEKFGEVIDEWKNTLPYTTMDAFVNYAVKREDWWNLPLTNYSTQLFVDRISDLSIASVPESICLEPKPGTGNGTRCSESNLATGGGTCNVVAWGLLDQNLGADIALVKACLLYTSPSPRDRG